MPTRRTTAIVAAAVVAVTAAVSGGLVSNHQAGALSTHPTPIKIGKPIVLQNQSATAADHHGGAETPTGGRWP